MMRLNFRAFPIVVSTSITAPLTFTETDTTRLGQARGFYRVVIPSIP